MRTLAWCGLTAIEFFSHFDTWGILAPGGGLLNASVMTNTKICKDPPLLRRPSAYTQNVERVPCSMLNVLSR